MDYILYDTVGDGMHLYSWTFPVLIIMSNRIMIHEIILLIIKIFLQL